MSTQYHPLIIWKMYGGRRYHITLYLACKSTQRWLLWRTIISFCWMASTLPSQWKLMWRYRLGNSTLSQPYITERRPYSMFYIIVSVGLILFVKVVFIDNTSILVTSVMLIISGKFEKYEWLDYFQITEYVYWTEYLINVKSFHSDDIAQCSSDTIHW